MHARMMIFSIADLDVITILMSENPNSLMIIIY